MNEMVEQNMAEQNRVIVISYNGMYCNDTVKSRINSILCEYGVVLSSPVGFITLDEDDIAKLIVSAHTKIVSIESNDGENKLNKTLIDAVIFVDNFYKENVAASAKAIDTIKVVIETMHNSTLRNCFKLISNYSNQEIIDYSKKFTNHQFSLAFIKVIKDIVNNVSWGTCE